MPENIDYLQIDLDAGNGSTMGFRKLDAEVFDKYKFTTSPLSLIIIAREITNQPVKSQGNI